jgi:adenylate cyclase
MAIIWRKPFLLVLFFALVGPLCNETIWHVDTLLAIEEWAYARHFPRPNAPRSCPVILIDKDDDAIGQYGTPPWSRELYAAIINRVAEHHPRVIAVDTIFDTPRSSSGDRELIRAVQSAGNVILAAGNVSNQANRRELRGPFPELAAAALGVGQVSAPREVGLSRIEHATQSLAIEATPTREQYAPLFGLVASRYLGQPIVVEQRGIHSRYRLGSKYLPDLAPIVADRWGHHGRFAVLFLDISAFVRISASDVLRGGALDAVNDRIVIVGSTAKEVGDYLQTPVSLATGEPTPGLVMLASAICNLVGGQWIRVVGKIGQAAICSALALILWIIGRRLPSAHQTYFSMVIGCAWAVLVWGAFELWLVSLCVTPGLLALGASRCLMVVVR